MQEVDQVEDIDVDKGSGKNNKFNFSGKKKQKENSNKKKQKESSGSKWGSGSYDSNKITGSMSND